MAHPATALAGSFLVRRRTVSSPPAFHSAAIREDANRLRSSTSLPRKSWIHRLPGDREPVLRNHGTVLI